MNWYKILLAAQRRVEQRMDWNEIDKRGLSIRSLFYEYVLPTTKRLYPDFPTEHYSFSTFTNMSRESTGLDNRRRDRDSVFTNAGTEIKALTNKCIQTFGLPEFGNNVTELVHRLHKWYYEESPSGELIQRPRNRQVDYRKLFDMGIRITPEQGKILSKARQRTPRLQKIRDEFMNAMNKLDDGITEPIMKWWSEFNGDVNNITNEQSEIPIPIPPIVNTPSETEEIWDWKNDKFIKVPKTKV